MLTLSTELHAIFSGLLRDRLGLHYGHEDREVLADRLSTRAIDAGFASLLDYYYHLRYDAAGDAELAALGETLVVHESYLFRGLDQLQAAADECARAIERGERPRVWSAACAAGEEPLTLAMLLDARGLLDRTRILATDLSARVLTRARTGTWTRRGLRDDVVPELVDRYLQLDDRSVRIAPGLVNRIEWQQLNLVDADQVARVPACDVILCRNVLIYFDDDTVRRVVRSIAERLRPGGRLYVGVAESLLRFETSLVCEEHGGVFSYRRPA